MTVKAVSRRNLITGIVTLVVAMAVYVLGNNITAGVMFWMILIFSLSSGVVLFVPQGRIEFSVEGQSRGEKSAPCSFRIKIRHTMLSLIKKGSLSIGVENLLTGEKSRIELPLAGSLKRTVDQQIRIREDNCGSLQVSLEEINWYGFCGIFLRKVPLQVRGNCLIMPTLSVIEERDDIWDAYDMESHRYSQVSKGGDPGEVFSLREYIPGDSPKQIHWKLSGKLSQIIVKEPSLPVDNKLMILFDKDGEQLSTPEQRSEAAELCGSLSLTALRRGISHSIGWYDQKNQSFRIHIIQGEEDLWGALEAMLQVGFWEEEESTVYRYLEAELESRYRNIIYVSKPGKDMERLQEYGQVHLYRPGSAEQ